MPHSGWRPQRPEISGRLKRVVTRRFSRALLRGLWEKNWIALRAEQQKEQHKLKSYAILMTWRIYLLSYMARFESSILHEKKQRNSHDWMVLYVSKLYQSHFVLGLLLFCKKIQLSSLYVSWSSIKKNKGKVRVGISNVALLLH